MATQSNQQTQQPTGPSKLDALKAKVRGQLEEASQKLAEMKQEIAADHQQDKKALSKKREEIQKRVEAQKQKFEEMRTDVSAWMSEKKSQTDATISSWRERREVEKLGRRADRASDFAVNALYIAIQDVEAAEAAVLDALDASLDYAEATKA